MTIRGQKPTKSSFELNKCQPLFNLCHIILLNFREYMIFLTKKSSHLGEVSYKSRKNSKLYDFSPRRISLNRSSVKNDSPLRLSFRNIEKWGCEIYRARRYAPSLSGVPRLGKPSASSLRSLRSLAIRSIPLRIFLLQI